MDHDSPKDLQASFGDILKEEFGTGVPQLATVVAVVLGSFGLRDYFDAGAWTVSAVLCFAAVFLYRRHIPNRLPKMTLLVAGFVVIMILFGIWCYQRIAAGQAFWTWEKSNKLWVTAYFSFLASVSIACLITSYKKQEKVFGLVYPESIEKAIGNQLHALDFYKKDVIYDVTFTSVENDWITVVTELSYVVVNRTKEQKFWSMDYKYDPKVGGKALAARFGSEMIDHSDKKYLTEVGISIPRRMEPGQKSKVYLRVEEHFRLRDSELYTSYYPATDLKIIARKKVQRIEVYFEILHFSDPPPKHKPDESSIYLDSGLLPYQGVRMSWRTS